jgi:hypothetical protein
VRRIGTVVEGLGDRRAISTLVAKTAQLLGMQVYVSHIVEGGGWARQKKPDELEKNCFLAAADENVDGILVLVDLEDDCAKDEYEQQLERLASIGERLGMPVELCFCIREYETWFLQTFAQIREASPDIDWERDNLEAGAVSCRGAKECFERHLGSHYRPPIDQDKFTKRMDLSNLLEKDRSFQKFAKAIGVLGTSPAN